MRMTNRYSYRRMFSLLLSFQRKETVPNLQGVLGNVHSVLSHGIWEYCSLHVRVVTLCVCMLERFVFVFCLFTTATFTMPPPEYHIRYKNWQEMTEFTRETYFTRVLISYSEHMMLCKLHHLNQYILLFSSLSWLESEYSNDIFSVRQAVYRNKKPKGLNMVCNGNLMRSSN